MNTKLTQELFEQQLNVKGFSSNTKAPIRRLTDPLQDTPMVVTLDQLRPYEHNPRQTRNPLYDEIKASILARGLDQPPPITRRPNEDHYIIRNGGNTRLAVLNELWKETSDERFYKIHCLFKPWTTEITALAGHLAENELHGQLSFIEKAQGVAKVKAMYEADGESLSLRKLSERLKADGYPISHGLLGHMLECLNSIQPALPNTLLAGLGSSPIARLIALKNNLAKVWAKYEDSDFLEFWLMVLSVYDNGPDAFDYSIIQDAMIGQMATLLGQSYDSISLDLEIAGSNATLNKNPLSQAQLDTIASNPPGLRQTQTTDSQEHNGGATPAEKHENPQTASNPSPRIPAAGTHPAAPQNCNSFYTDDDDDSTDEELPDDEVQLAARSIPDRQDTQSFIDGHVVSPSQESAQMTRIRTQVAQQLGETLPNFEEQVLQSIPVMAGGRLGNVSDVWYIERRIDFEEQLRNNIWGLVDDIAKFAGVNGFIQSQEGLGFGYSPEGQQNDPQTPRANTVRLLLTSILRLHDRTDPNALPAPLSAALFGQALIGTYDITIGSSAPKDVELETLPDVELVKLFRLIRLARRLIELLKSVESGQYAADA